MTNPSFPLPPRPVVLCILDGWGYREEQDNNAIALANTPNWDRLTATCPTSFLETSGLDVGLPVGQMGNSEVGHMNIGAGRVVMQDLPRIDQAIETGALAKNPELLSAIDRVRETGGVFHLAGLLSSGGVHAHSSHIAALARIISDAGVLVRIHAFLDGRDTPPSSALAFMRDFQEKIKGTSAVIATLSGRFYAMDRDKRWDRVEACFNVMVEAKGVAEPDALSAIADSYAAGITDEFLIPVPIGDYQGMKDGDGLLMCNFRADRARETLGALIDPAFDGFRRARLPIFAARLGMTEYSDALSPLHDVLFPAEKLTGILGEIVQDAGLTQLRIAETEKYAHVTFFLNGGREQVFEREDRILIPSPKVATYDQAPEMSAIEVTDHLVKAIQSGKYDLIVVNYANGDMVGHTGILSAAIKAAETVDCCLGRLADAVKEAHGAMLVTADHGNAELMRDPVSEEPYTAHTVGPVKALLFNGGKILKNGRLGDVAPTLLRLMGLRQPSEMTGRSLIGVERDDERPPRP